MLFGPGVATISERWKRKNTEKQRETKSGERDNRRLIVQLFYPHLVLTGAIQRLIIHFINLSSVARANGSCHATFVRCEMLYCKLYA